MSASLTEEMVRSLSTTKSYARGVELYGIGAIFDTFRQGDLLLGKCEGSSAPFYELSVEIDGGGVRSVECTCPYEYGGLCKHLVALLLTFVHDAEDFTERRPVSELLDELTREELADLVVKLVEAEPDLYDRVEMALIASPTHRAKGGPESQPEGEAKPQEKGKQRQTAIDEQTYRRQVKSILRSLSGYRMSEAYWMMGGMVEDLRRVQKTAYEFLASGDAESAKTILVILLTEVADSFDEFDDSDGVLGNFAEEVGEALAEVILSLDLQAKERKALQKRLEPVVDELVSYGIDEISVVIAALEGGWDFEVWVDEDGGWGGDLTQAKLNVLERQDRVDEFLELCQARGEYRRYVLKLLEIGRLEEAVLAALNQLDNAPDALTVAQRLRELGEVHKAMVVGERGLNLAGHQHALGTWLGPLEESMGRTEQALQAYRVAFNSRPSLELYQILQRLAGPNWDNLKAELIVLLKNPAYLDELADVYLYEQEWDAAIALVKPETRDYRLAEKVAEAVLAHRPEWVIQVCVAQADVLIAKTQSRYYPAAAAWLKRMKKAYAVLGRQEEWEDYLADLRRKYIRRPALQAELKKL
jgi:uncharacterized Zn finger protein